MDQSEQMTASESDKIFNEENPTHKIKGRNKTLSTHSKKSYFQSPLKSKKSLDKDIMHTGKNINPVLSIYSNQNNIKNSIIHDENVINPVNCQSIKKGTVHPHNSPEQSKFRVESSPNRGTFKKISVCKNKDDKNAKGRNNSRKINKGTSIKKSFNPSNPEIYSLSNNSSQVVKSVPYNSPSDHKSMLNYE